MSDLLKDYTAGLLESGGKMVLLFKILEEALAIEDKILVFRSVQSGKKSEKIIIFFANLLIFNFNYFPCKSTFWSYGTRLDLPKGPKSCIYSSDKHLLTIYEGTCNPLSH